MSWRRLLLLNLALVAALIWGALQVRERWRNFEATHRPDTIRPENEPALAVPGVAATAGTAQDWTEIPVKNPFSFDRNDIAVVALKAAAPNQPKPVLFGTMAIGNERIAMLGPGQSGTRNSRPVKVGESFDDFWQVIEIRDTSVIVTAATGARETIILNDPRAQVPRSSERTGGGAAAPSVNVINAPAVTTQAPANSAAQTAPPPPPTTTGQPTGEMLMTPFGPVPRTKP